MLFLLTNKVTHARAVVAAKSADEAKRMHPTHCTATWKGSRWTTFKGGHFYREVEVAPPEGWTTKMELIHADPIGVEPRGSIYEGVTDVVVYMPSTDLRQGAPNQEGPDETWGGYSLEDL